MVICSGVCKDLTTCADLKPTGIAGNHTGVALGAPVAHQLSFEVACLSILAGAALVPWTSHAILIGVAEQFKPLMEYMSCSLVTLSDDIFA